MKYGVITAVTFSKLMEDTPEGRITAGGIDEGEAPERCYRRWWRRAGSAGDAVGKAGGVRDPERPSRSLK